MKKRTLAILIALVLLLAVVIPVAAVTDGVPDGDGHPFVGLMVAFDNSGNPQWRCSGTLLSQTIFLTAGHCTEAPAARAEVWFESDVEPLVCPRDVDGKYIPGNCYPFKGNVSGTTYTHPDYYNFAWFTHDLGVVILDTPVTTDKNGNPLTYGALPALNQLDELKKGKKGATFTSVGYGLQKAFPDAASWKDVAFKTRYVSYPFLIQINTPGFTGDFSLLLSNNHATGGTCYGDSGGPNFLGDSNVIAGVTSYGMNPTCAGTGGVYRLDQADDLEWLCTFGVGTCP